MFLLDPRGGHNRYNFNKDFFKIWTPEMAYVLGFMYADGNICDSVVSRAQYVSFDSNDRDILEKIKVVLSSSHKIQVKPEKVLNHFNGKYKSKESFRLRIGSREMFSDLIELGVTPRKSLTIECPRNIPSNYLHHFVRGYFDGDGCVHIMKGKGKYGQDILKGLAVIFTSGSKIFLEGLRKAIEEKGLKDGKIYFSSNAYLLKYPTSESIQFFKFFYNDATLNLFLKRKFEVFKKYFNMRTSRADSMILNIINYGHVAK